MSASPSVISVGNFDGVHLGHRALIAAARRLADPLGARVVVVAFDPHPATVLRPGTAPPSLTDRDQRRAALLDAGADHVAWLAPDPATVLSLTPRQFAQKMRDEHGVVGWIEGPDFRFGHKRAGDADTLRQLGGELGFEFLAVDPIDAVLRDKTAAPASSSLVRWLVSQGRVVDAALCLGRPFAVRGRVVQGEQRGRDIGFPTANVDADGRVLPADGVYGGWATIDGVEYAAAISVGVKPTFGGDRRVFEAYLLGFTGELYGRTIEVAVTRWLRDQAKYDSLDALIEQMNRDVQTVRVAHADRLLDASMLVIR